MADPFLTAEGQILLEKNEQAKIAILREAETDLEKRTFPLLGPLLTKRCRGERDRSPS